VIRSAAKDSSPDSAPYIAAMTMRLLITGAGGTLGRALCSAARDAGHEVLPWPRDVLDPLVLPRQEDWILQQGVQAVLHLAVASQSTGAPDEGRRINVDWGVHLAGIAARHGLPLVFSSTAMVYDAEADGPYTLASAPTPRNDYGRQKLQAEHAMLLRHPGGVRVARLGWQIDPTRCDGNHMVAHGHRAMHEHGHITASRLWRPACSFVDDTAQALLRLVGQPPGVYLVDSNIDGTSFDRLLQALSDTYRLGWQVKPGEYYRHDQRLIDPRPGLPRLHDRLPSLVV
jgi:dTDP-4-dehydrorhamnose reductase